MSERRQTRERERGGRWSRESKAQEKFKSWNGGREMKINIQWKI